MKTAEMIGGDGDRGKVAGHVGQMRNGIRQCNDHPFMANHGGICAFCLQEKLAKLVSCSLPSPLRYSPPSSSSFSHSFQSDYAGAGPLSSSLTLPIRSAASITVNGRRASGTVYRHDEYFYTGRILISSLTARKKNKSTDMVLKRSKSTNTCTTPKRNQYLDTINGGGDFSRRNRDKSFRENSRVVLMADPTPTATIIEEDETLDSFVDSKDSRSRSVGCGSRIFSGDIFERIWTGFGDCPLRRVESQRESKQKVSEGKVKCGGLFGGFVVSSSVSSSSSDWVSSDHSK